MAVCLQTAQRCRCVHRYCWLNGCLQRLWTRCWLLSTNSSRPASPCRKQQQPRGRSHNQPRMTCHLSCGFTAVCRCLLCYTPQLSICMQTQLHNSCHLSAVKHWHMITVHGTSCSQCHPRRRSLHLNGCTTVFSLKKEATVQTYRCTDCGQQSEQVLAADAC